MWIDEAVRVYQYSLVSASPLHIVQFLLLPYQSFLPTFLQASASLMTKYRIGHPEEFREEVERQFEEPEA